jgi:hypothetical protein
MCAYRNPAYARTVQVVGRSTADYCDVAIAEEQMTLRFERQPDGVIRCSGRMHEDPDGPDRASKVGFNAARVMAIACMNKLRDGEKVRSEMEEPIISFSSTVECSMSYAGNAYSFLCRVDLALSWSSLYLGSKIVNKPDVYLSDVEMRRLKQRAFSKILMRRKLMECYGEDGLQPFTPTKQLSLAL